MLLPLPATMLAIQAMTLRVTKSSLTLLPPPRPTVRERITNQPLPVIFGTAVGDLAVLQVEVVGVGTWVSDADGPLQRVEGLWYLDLSLAEIDPLSDGTYEIIVTATKASGASSRDLTNDELTIDTSSLTPPTVVSRSTNNPHPVIVGTFDAGENNENTLRVVVTGPDDANATALSFDLSSDDELIRVGPQGWLLSLANIQPGLTDGTYDVTATVTNLAGTSQDDLTEQELTVITVPPSIPRIDFLGSGDGRPLLTGSAESDINLIVIVNGIVYESGIAPELTQEERSLAA